MIANLDRLSRNAAFLLALRDSGVKFVAVDMPEVPRQCVFAGTVNPDTYLRDETGNRRFWPLRCGTIDIAALARDRQPRSYGGGWVCDIGYRVEGAECLPLDIPEHAYPTGRSYGTGGRRGSKASGNPDTYLRDETGNRRFWPLRCGAIDITALARDRDQLWAEAVHRFREGAIWWIDDPALLAEARKEQDRRYQSDAWDDLIEHWLTHEIRTVSDGYPDYGNSRTESVLRTEPLADVSVGEILDEAIGLEPARWTRGDQMRVSAYLKANGWERYRRRDEGKRAASREWRYRRGSV